MGFLASQWSRPHAGPARCFPPFENRCEHLKVSQKHRRHAWNRSLVSYDDSHAVRSTNRAVPGWSSNRKPSTNGLGGDQRRSPRGLLRRDRHEGPYASSLLVRGEFFSWLSAAFRSAPPPSFGGLPKAVGLTGQAPWLIYSSPQLTGRAWSFFANAAALDGRSPKRRSVVALIPFDCSLHWSSLSNEEERMNFPHVRSKPVFFCFLVAGVAMGVSVRMFGGDVSNRAQPKRESLEIKNEFKVQPPKQAETVRRWFAYGWLPLDVSLANIYSKVFAVTDKNKKLVELTTATGYKGLNPSKVDYYFGNLDERRVTWSTGRDLIMQPLQEDGPVNALAKMYVEIDGKQSTDWTRELTYAEATK